MAHNNNVLVRIEFIIRARRNFIHRHQLTAFDVRGFVLPLLTAVEQRKRFAGVELLFTSSGLISKSI